MNKTTYLKDSQEQTVLKEPDIIYSGTQILNYTNNEESDQPTLEVGRPPYGGVGEQINTTGIKVLRSLSDYQSSNTSYLSITLFSQSDLKAFIEAIKGLSKNTTFPPFSEEGFNQVYLKIEPLLNKAEIIKIPRKTKRTIEKYMPKGLLKAIDIDESVAVEKCLIFLSLLTDTIYSEEKWKELHSTILRDLFDDYQSVIKALEYGTKKNGAFIEVKKHYEIGKKCRKYKLTDRYSKAGFESYVLKNKELVQKRYDININRIKEELNINSICRNLFNVYPHIQLPTEEEIIIEAKRLVAEGYKTKKGKTLTFLNGHQRDRWKDVRHRTFVEECVAIFNYYTKDGFLIPTIGDEKSGGRIVDSFTLMPSWIRNLCKIDGERIVDVDYSCLHPNIAMKLYGGISEFITHEKVAEKLGIDVKIAKIEHVSFFNRRQYGMEQSPLFNYYNEAESKLIKYIFADKKENGHEETSKKLFKEEVKLMTQAVNILNENGIYVGYVYDALFCHPQHRDFVVDVLNYVASINKIKTTAH